MKTQIKNLPIQDEEIRAGQHRRSCNFCGFTGLYVEFPDNTVCFENVVACAPCLKKPETKEFRAHIKGKKY